MSDMKGDPTKVIHAVSMAYCRVYLDEVLLSHVTGFNTKEGWVDQLRHADLDGSGDRKWVVERFTGVVDAVFSVEAG